MFIFTTLVTILCRCINATPLLRTVRAVARKEVKGRLSHPISVHKFWRLAWPIPANIHTFIFRCSPRGFSATCLQQMQGSVVEGLSQTATSGSQCFFCLRH